MNFLESKWDRIYMYNRNKLYVEINERIGLITLIIIIIFFLSLKRFINKKDWIMLSLSLKIFDIHVSKNYESLINFLSIFLLFLVYFEPIQINSIPSKLILFFSI